MKPPARKPAAQTGKGSGAANKAKAGNPAAGTVRIIGGDWRRRLLRFPDSEGLRPTPDRVRETLFNWLGQELDGWSCLDLFAGSGALGFEAASRGAARVVLVEAAPKVFSALRDNAKTLDSQGRLEIVKGDALQYLASSGSTFDLVFLDPPYRQGWIERMGSSLHRVAGDDTAIYVEAEYEIDSLASGPRTWRTVRRGRAGEVHFHLLQQDPKES